MCHSHDGLRSQMNQTVHDIPVDVWQYPKHTKMSGT